MVQVRYSCIIHGTWSMTWYRQGTAAHCCQNQDGQAGTMGMDHTPAYGRTRDWIYYKQLDGVGLVDKRPSTDKLDQFVKKKKKKKYRWHVTGDMWHVTQNTLQEEPRSHLINLASQVWITRWEGRDGITLHFFPACKCWELDQQFIRRHPNKDSKWTKLCFGPI